MEAMSLPLYARAATAEPDGEDRPARDLEEGGGGGPGRRPDGRAPGGPAAARGGLEESHENSPLRRPSLGSRDRQDSSDGGSARSLPGLPLNEPQNVRLNVVQSVAATPLLQRRIVVYLQTVLLLPPVFIAVIQLSMALDRGEECDVPLELWGAVNAMTWFAALACEWILYLQEEESEERMSPLRRRALAMRRPLDNFNFGWVLIGQLVLSGAGACVDSAPTLVSMVVRSTTYGIFYFFLPCIGIIIMLPFLCFCLPCIIRLLARFAITEPFGGKGASQDDIDALPLDTYRDGMLAEEVDPQCSICLSSYEEGQEIRILPCDTRHHFHRECCDEWLTVNATCPICRASVLGGRRPSEDVPVAPSGGASDVRV